MPQIDSSPALNAVANTDDTAPQRQRGGLTLTQLLLIAALVTAGFALNFTAGKLIAGTAGDILAPEFLVAALCLAVLLIRPDTMQALAIGVISAAAAQITTTSPGIDFIAEGVAAIVMASIVNTHMKQANSWLVPALGTLITTLCSGCIFVGARMIMTTVPTETLMGMLQIVAVTSLLNAVLVGVLYRPLKSLLKIA